MSKILKSIFKFIKNIIKKIVSFIKKFWWVILLVLAIWFAPVIAVWLTGAGAPAWLSTAFTWVGSTITPSLTSAGAWLVSGAKSLFVGPTAPWAALPMSVKGGLALGGAALLFPDEVGELIEGVAEGTGELVGDLAGSVASGVFGSGLGGWLLIAAGGLVAYKVLTKEKRYA